VSAEDEGLRVLVVDDEPNIVDVVSMALRHHGFDVKAADTGAGALLEAREWRPHALVLDVMLPDIDGFEVAKRLSDEHARVPILFLSARDATADKVRGLTAGGGDYVTKPFSLEELMARLRNMLRRTGSLQNAPGRLVFADLELDEDTHEVSRDGRAVELTATEYRLLRYFMLNPRRVLARAQLLDHVWSYDFAGDARILETYMSYLREDRCRPCAPVAHGARSGLLPAAPEGLSTCRYAVDCS
jgi:two-component system, OmpR family, response regulator